MPDRNAIPSRAARVLRIDKIVFVYREVRRTTGLNRREAFRYARGWWKQAGA